MNYFSEKLQSLFLKFSRQKAETDRIQNEILSVLNFQIHSPLTTVIEVVYFLLYTRVSSSLVSSVVLEKVCDECEHSAKVPKNLGSLLYFGLHS